MEADNKNKKVFVGVSGGVDSSVSAAMLLEQGYDVTGVFLRTWQPEWIECTWRDERRDAMRVCAHLGIPFVELDMVDQYKNGVADYMISEYRVGRTPNPDVMCNREVKFGGFLDWAIEHGADYVATGHYVRNINDQLVRGNDPDKDQSYFLWMLSQDQLRHVLFPVGHLPKSEVRSLAEKYSLPTAAKKDSQGVCFLGQIDMRDFLGHYIDQQPGDVLDMQGGIIGSHDGALFYTLGERHGFTITEKTPDERPYYVVKKNIQENTITVDHNPEPAQIACIEYQLDSVNNIGGDIEIGKKYQAQIRYHGQIFDIEVARLGGATASVVFTKPIIIASGQSVVIYDGDVCAGGGVVVG